MNQRIEPTPPRLSTGVELEFAVLYVFHESNLFSTSGEEKIINDELPQPLCVPYPMDSNKEDLEALGQRAVEDALREALKDADLPTEVIDIKAGVALATEHLSLFRHWSVDSDSTVRASGLQDIKTQHKLRFAAIEIKTPVEWDSPLSFEVIRYAVNLLTSKFRIQINPSMGLHVHIGNGAAWVPFNWVRRMSMLFWAADRLLGTLNPPTRAYNYYCPDIRDFSKLAQNDHNINVPDHEYDQRQLNGFGQPRRPLLCKKYIATDVRPGESSTTWRETHSDQNTIDEFGETRQPGHFEPFFIKSDPGGGEPSATLAEDLPFEEHIIDLKAATSNASSTISNPELINEKISSPYEWTRAGLTRRNDDLGPSQTTPGLGKRLNGFPRLKMPKWSEGDLRNIDQVNIDYSDHGLDRDRAEDRGVWFGVEQISQTNASCEIANMLDSGYRANFNLQQYKCEYIGRSRCFAKATIEWRQGAGSMDAKWVSTWARIVVGVSRFAIHAPVDLFLRVLGCCDFAEKGGSYDVLDFLEDIGLVAEAQVAGQRIYDYGKDWGLKYEGQSEHGDGEVEESGEGEETKEGEKSKEYEALKELENKAIREETEGEDDKGKEIDICDADEDSEDGDYSVFL